MRHVATQQLQICYAERAGKENISFPQMVSPIFGCRAAVATMSMLTLPATQTLCMMHIPPPQGSLISRPDRGDHRSSANIPVNDVPVFHRLPLILHALNE